MKNKRENFVKHIYLNMFKRFNFSHTLNTLKVSFYVDNNIKNLTPC